MSIGTMRAYRGDTDRRFYTGMAIAILVTVFAGFAPTFYLKSWFAPPLPALVFTHGLAFSAWIALFVVQTVLIAGKRADLHRRLGVVGACLAAGMVILGIAAAIWSIRASHTPPRLEPRSFLALPLFGIAMFAALATLGIALRRRPQAHKRLMLLATIAMLDAAIARLPGVLALGIPVPYGLQDLFLVACAARFRRAAPRSSGIRLGRARDPRLAAVAAPRVADAAVARLRRLDQGLSCAIIWRVCLSANRRPLRRGHALLTCAGRSRSGT